MRSSTFFLMQQLQHSGHLYGVYLRARFVFDSIYCDNASGSPSQCRAPSNSGRHLGRRPSDAADATALW